MSDLEVFVPHGAVVPTLFADAGDRAAGRLIQFLTAEVQNPNTRTAYARAIRQFSDWCELHRLPLSSLSPFHVAAYIEELGRRLAKPSVKQHLAALRMLGDYLVVGQVLPANPAAAVRGPRYSVKVGKTPVLTPAETAELFAAIDPATPIGLRDRALIALMAYTFARVGAATGMDVTDYHQQGKRWWVLLHEKGGKDHLIPCHHTLEEYLDAYLDGTGLRGSTGPLFRVVGRDGRLTGRRLNDRDTLAMVKRRASAVGLGAGTCNHSFRATGITTFLANGGVVETAQAIAAHESPRTTKLYDRRGNALTLDEIERVRYE